MDVVGGQANPGEDGLLFRPTKARAKKVRQNVEGLWIIYQAKLLHPLDLDRWTEIFETTVSSLLSTQPLQSLTKRARLGVVMSIVGSGRTHLHTPAVLAVLATDWSDEWASFKLLQDTVRQASLSHLRYEWGPNGPPELHVSRKHIADLLCVGVEKTVASWRNLGIGGSARDAVEKAGRELRGLAAQCRGSSNRPAAGKLLSCYLASHRVERFTEALISWGQEQMGASKPTIFDQAFPFLGLRQIQASQSRADARREPKEARDPTNTQRASSPAVYGPSFDVMDKADTQAETSRWEEGKEAEKSEGSRKRRKIGALLRLDESVVVRKKGTYGEPDLWRRGAIETCRGDGTYDVRYEDDGAVGHLVRRQEIFGPEESDIPTGILTPPDATSARRSPLKRLQTISRASADGYPLPPRSQVSEEHTTAGSTSPRTAMDDVDDSWCVTDVDEDSDVALVASGTREGDYTRLNRRRNRKRRVFPDDKCEDNDSTTAASDATAAVRDRQPSLSRFSNEDDGSSQPPLLCSDDAPSEGVAGSHAEQKGTGKKEEENKEEGGLCGGFHHQDKECAHDDEGGPEGVDGEEDETDEELAEETFGKTLEEEDVETDEEVQTSTRDITGVRRQRQEEDTEADAGRVGEGVGNRADDVIGSSAPAVNEMPSKNGQGVEPKEERASTEHHEKDTEENTRPSSVGEEERTHGAGAGDFTTPSPVLRVPPTIQNITDTDAGQDTCSEQRNEASPRDEGTRNGEVDDVVDNQPPGRPTHFMRVYGSAGIARVRESMGAWFCRRQPNCETRDAP